MPLESFVDKEDDELELNVILENDKELPDWLNFDKLIRKLSGKPINPEDISLKIIATDRQGKFKSQILKLEIKESTKNIIMTMLDYSPILGVFGVMLIVRLYFLEFF